jgi:mediator of RNA polymerase II transcription subunit 6
MTAVHSLQSSLNALRAARPTFTPRTGFIWPIVESSSSKPDTDGARKREEGGDTTVGADMAPAKHRQQNNMLLLNAMRTTAAHTNSAATPDWELELQAEPNATSASGPGSGQGTSPTSGTPRGPSVAPLPTSAQAETQSSRRPSVVEPSDAPGGVKGIPGAGKKKRKRERLWTGRVQLVG